MAKFKLADGTEIEAFTKEELSAEIEKEVSGLKAKNSELLTETKAEKEKRLALENAQAEAETARAKERGEFKELYERTQKEKNELSDKFSDFSRKIQQKEIEENARNVALLKTKEPSRIEALSEQLAKFSKHTENGIKYELGGVEVEHTKVLDHIIAKFPFLEDGSGVAGGGAMGGGRDGGAVNKTSIEKITAGLAELTK